MNCRQFEARLNDLLDERAPLELDDLLQGHLRCCAPCRELWAAYGEMLQVVRFRSPPEPRPDLAERIVAAAVAAQTDGTRSVPTARGFSGRLLWRAAAIAAAAAVLIAVCWRFDPPGDGVVAPVDNLAEKDPPATEPRPLAELAQDAANCYAGLARETRSELSDVLALVPRVESTPAAVLWSGGAAVPTPEVASHVREGLRPLTQSTMAALTSLFGGTTPENGDL